jgi:hypothetical protein
MYIHVSSYTSNEDTLDFFIAELCPKYQCIYMHIYIYIHIHTRKYICKCTYVYHHIFLMKILQICLM